ncbi:MAG UNVERIFIED_CONTAM: hypothetical protein LVT10_06335 [Anaerolineae bacterium]
MELAGILREHLRLSGLTVSQIRPFRDKLAMRETAHRAGILVPPFIGIKNYDELRAYMADVPSLGLKATHRSRLNGYPKGQRCRASLACA